MIDMLVDIVPSLIATGLVILFMWIYNRKRESDKKASEFQSLINGISSLSASMENRFVQVENRFDQVNNRFDQVNNENEALRIDFRKLADTQEVLKNDIDNITNQFLKTMLQKTQDILENYESDSSKNRSDESL